MSAENSMTDLLAAPLEPDWTVDLLAEKVLGAIVERGSEGTREFVLDADSTNDRQSRRLLRPLLACLAMKSAAEKGTKPNLYEGRISFKRRGLEGPVWIFGQFENRPGAARVSFRCSYSPSANSEVTTELESFLPATSSRPVTPSLISDKSGPDNPSAPMG
jgi:hypothetical protein